MSLVPTWVLAHDGMYYKNPVLRSNAEIWNSPHGGPVEREKWFICFDDDDPPEIVIAFDHFQGDVPFRYSRRGIADRAVAILKALNIRHTLNFRRPRISGRCFGKDLRFANAGAFFFTIKSPLPVPARNLYGKCSKQYSEALALGVFQIPACTLEYDNIATFEEVMKHECVIYSFGRKS